MSTYTAANGVNGFRLPKRYDHNHGISTSIITLPTIELTKYKRYAPAAFVPAISILLGTALINPPLQTPQPTPEPGGFGTESQDRGSDDFTFTNGTDSGPPSDEPVNPPGSDSTAVRNNSLSNKESASTAAPGKPSIEPYTATPEAPPVGGRGAGTVWDVSPPSSSEQGSSGTSTTPSSEPADNEPVYIEPTPPTTPPPADTSATVEAEIGVQGYEAQAGVDVIDPSITLETNLTP